MMMLIHKILERPARVSQLEGGSDFENQSWEDRRVMSILEMALAPFPFFSVRLFRNLSSLFNSPCAEHIWLVFFPLLFALSCPMLSYTRT